MDRWSNESDTSPCEVKLTGSRTEAMQAKL